MAGSHFGPSHFGQRHFAARHWGRLLEAVKLSLAGQIYVLKRIVSESVLDRFPGLVVRRWADVTFASVSEAPDVTAASPQAEVPVLLSSPEVAAGEKPTTVFSTIRRADLFASAAAAGVVVRDARKYLSASTSSPPITINTARKKP